MSLFIQFIFISTMLVLVFLLSLYLGRCATTPPTWVTSNLVRAGNQNVINTQTTSNVTPTYTFVFSSALSTIPYLGYGVKRYQAYDYIGHEYYEINRVDLNSTSFTVSVQIIGSTFILKLNVAYIAIQPSFPYHLNSFDNVPVNYMAGSLINITTSSNSTQTYTNTIDYTSQAAGRVYTTFSSPLSKNKIVLFLTTIHFQGQNQNSKQNTTRPVDLYVSTQIISTNQYKITTTLTKMVNISALHFSMIIFSQNGYSTTENYIFVEKRIDWLYTGGFLPIPQQFIPNLIMGFLDFSSNKTRVILDFQWDFTVVNGIHGVLMPQSIGETFKDKGNETMNRVAFSLFYIKTWICPNKTFIDHSTNLCTSCIISNCLDCYNLTICNVCDEANNFFLVPATRQCSLCNLGGCLDCLNLTKCQICNSANNYSLTNSSCQFCNYSQNVFLNSLGDCQACSLVGCLQCASLTTCFNCDMANGYYLAPSSTICNFCNSSSNMFLTSSSQCKTCNLTGCLQCASLTTCFNCDMENGYYLLLPVTSCSFCDNLLNMFINTGTNQCQLCNITGCTKCSSLSSCIICDVGNSYYLLPNFTCVLCISNYNLFFNPSNQCEACNLTGCLQCLSLSSCAVCDQNLGYYLQPSQVICSYCDPLLNLFVNGGGNQCQTCNLTGCIYCFNLSSCSTCDLNNSFYLPPSSVICSFCNSSVSMFINFTTSQCESCNLFGCLVCQNLSSCTTCDISNSYYLPPSSMICSYCSNATNMFINLSNQCQLCNLLGCLQCSSLNSCVVCDISNSYYFEASSIICSYCNDSSNMFLNNLTECQACNLTGCLQCSNLTSCSLCDTNNGYYLPSSGIMCSYCNSSLNMFVNSTTNTCQICTIENCLICSNLMNCLICNSSNGYFLFGSECQNCSTIGNCSQCGNGIVQDSEQCDDSNTNSYDGCSNICKTQQIFECSRSSNCFSTFFVFKQSLKVIKSGCNKFVIEFTTDSSIFLSDFQRIQSSNTGLNIENKELNGQKLSIMIAYTKDIYKESIYLYIPGTSLGLRVEANEGIPLLLYDQNQCKSYSNYKNLVEGIKIMGFIVLFISLFSMKIVGLELFGVFQLAYYALAFYDFQNPYLSLLTDFKIFNGLNLQFFTETSFIPQNIKPLGISILFLNNCNIMLIIMFGQLLIAATLYIISKMTGSEKLNKIGLRFLKEGFITVILFNLFNISFSAGIYLKYSPELYSSYLHIVFLTITMLVVFIATLCMQVLQEEEYGEFKNRFKDNCTSKWYIPLSILYRMLLGFYIALQNDYIEATLLILSASLAFIMYNIINLPFKGALHNYRCNVMHISQLIILFCANYYRSLKANTPMSIKGRIHTPAIIEIVAIIICLAVSFISLLITLVQAFCRSKDQKKIKEDSLRSHDNVTLQTMP